MSDSERTGSYAGDKPGDGDELERRTDPLLDLVGLVDRGIAEAAAFDDPRFADWMARESGVAPRRHERLTDEARSNLAARIASGILAERTGIVESGEWPRTEHVPAGGTVTQMIEDAERDHYAVVPGLAIAAGAGRELWDAECESIIRLPDEISRGRYVALMVKGDSMTPLLRDGDMVLVRLGEKADRGSVIVARDEDDGYVVKRVGRVSARFIELLSLNPEFPAMKVERSAHRVLGRAVLRWRRQDLHVSSGR